MDCFIVHFMPELVDQSASIDSTVLLVIFPATGSKTTIYNLENDGDPNANLDLEKDEVEQQYLIKWKNWSHLHNTWESETTLHELKVNGLKKLKNFKDREEVQHYWFVYLKQ